MFESDRWLVLLTMVLAVVFVGSGWPMEGFDLDRQPGEAALAAVNTLPLLAIRRNPLVVVITFGVVYPLWVGFDYPTHELQSLPTLAAMYALGGWARPLWLRATGLLVTAWMVTAAAVGMWEVEPLAIAYIGIVFAVVWTLGLVVSGRRAYARELEARTEELQAARQGLAEQAVASERARIARELHDVIAHAMSVITVQAGVGRHLIDRRPEQAAEALGVIEHTGREALEEMRRMLSVLRDSEGAGPLPEPQPGLDDIAPLVERARGAGASVAFETQGTPRALAPGMELAAYRVVQEALTNMIKHAPGSRGAVTVAYRPRALEVEIVNGLPSARTNGTAVQYGHGLRGMRERVALYAGELDAVAEDGRFRVTARFPVEQTS